MKIGSRAPFHNPPYCLALWLVAYVKPQYYLQVWTVTEFAGLSIGAIITTTLYWIDSKLNDCWATAVAQVTQDNVKQKEGVLHDHR